MLLLTGCGDVCEDKLVAYYIDGYVEPGEAAEVRIKQPWGTLASRIKEVTATAPEIGLDEKRVFYTEESEYWSSFRSSDSFMDIMRTLIKGDQKHPFQRVKIPVPLETTATGTVEVKLNVLYECAKWSSPGSFRVTSEIGEIAVPITIVPAGRELLYHASDVGLRVLVLLAITLAYRLTTRRMKKRWKYEEAPYVIAFVIWCALAITFGAWPIAGILGVPAHWRVRWLCLAVLLGLAYGAVVACMGEDEQ